VEKPYEKQYHELEETHWWFQGRRHILRRLVLSAMPNRDGRVLEIGCSGGMLIRQLESDGYRHVVGIDISPEAIEKCRRTGVENAMVMDGQRPGFSAESFNLITASDVLEHLRDPTGALKAWHTLLRPQGMLIVFVPAFMFLWSEHDVVNQHQKRYRLAELAQTLRAAGFQVVRSSYWNFLLFPATAVVRLAKRLFANGKGDAHPHGDLAPLPLIANWLLVRILRMENSILCGGFNWPWGLSAMVVARKS
jgi:2-polyprenyl-3-methyl-5-hydroxy-6-metoxy-1,4-benzoquinol methylase